MLDDGIEFDWHAPDAPRKRDAKFFEKARANEDAISGNSGEEASTNRGRWGIFIFLAIVVSAVIIAVFA